MKSKRGLPGKFELVARYFAPLADAFPGACALFGAASQSTGQMVGWGAIRPFIGHHHSLTVIRGGDEWKLRSAWSVLR